MTEYYGWQKTLSFDAPATLVITARGRGKTYGLRKQCIRDFLKDGSVFCEIVRYKSELPDVMFGYFDKLQREEFRDYVFKTEKSCGWIAKRSSAENEKPDWKRLCYFVALTSEQALRKKTFVGVRRIIFDEAILDRRNFKRYLNREYEVLLNMFDTLSREVSGKPTRARLYLLGNACDLTNPYFQHLQIADEPKAGYSWFKNKTFLLHYEQNSDFARGKNETVVGRLAQGTQAAQMIAYNKFINGGEKMIAQKPKSAKFSFGVIYKSLEFGIWGDLDQGFYYVNRKIPNGSNTVFTLTRADDSANYLAASRANKTLQNLADLYYLGCVRYDTPATREMFTKALALFGVR